MRTQHIAKAAKGETYHVNFTTSVLIGSSTTAAGIILPRFADKILSQVSDTGIPLLEVPKTQNQLFNAFYMDEYYLIADATVGPDLDLPLPTSRRKYLNLIRPKSQID